jgi:acyl-CoA hydrolase
MEIQVVGQVENLHTSIKHEALIAFLTFVGLDENNKSTEVPAVRPETEQEKRLFELGEKRYHDRKRKRAEMKTNSG